MKAVDDSFGWDADGGDEEFGAGGDYYRDEFVECWVVLDGAEVGRGEGWGEVGMQRGWGPVCGLGGRKLFGR